MAATKLTSVTDDQIDIALGAVDQSLKSRERGADANELVTKRTAETPKLISNVLAVTNASAIVDYMRATPLEFDYRDERLAGGMCRGTLRFGPDNTLILTYQEGGKDVVFRTSLNDTRDQLLGWKQTRKLDPRQLGAVMANLRKRLTPAATAQGDAAIVSTEALAQVVLNMKEEPKELDRSFGPVVAKPAWARPAAAKRPFGGRTQTAA